MKSKTAIAERKNRDKEQRKIRRTVTFTESTIVRTGNKQREEKTEISFVSPPLPYFPPHEEIVEKPAKSKKKIKHEINAQN